MRGSAGVWLCGVVACAVAGCQGPPVAEPRGDGQHGSESGADAANDAQGDDAGPFDAGPFDAGPIEVADGGLQIACESGLCQETCTIQSTLSWQSCGVQVHAGDVVAVSATGAWSIGNTADAPTCGPEGFWQDGAWWNPDSGTDSRLSTSDDFGTLLCAVTDSMPEVQAAFDATESTTSIQFTATSSGSLQFRINDSLLSDNAGSMQIIVVVNRDIEARRDHSPHHY